MKHVMVDLETAGKTARAGILQIGAVAFDPTTGELGREFKVRVTPQDDREMDPSTLVWWMQQSEAARMSAWSPKAGPWGLPPLDLLQSLSCFDEWLDEVCEGRSFNKLEGLWAHGILFDVAILEDAHRQFGLRIPWSYRAPRDTRTLFALACPSANPAKVIDELVGPAPEDFVQHDALHDARRQARAVIAAHLRLGRRL